MKHARLPASTAHRWTACPASAYMDESGDRRGSRYAAEGTAAHFLVERCLRDGSDPRDYMGRTIHVDENGDTLWGAEIKGDWSFEVNPEMVGAAMTFLQCTGDALITMDPGGVSYVEERVSPGHEHLGGTLDWAHVSGDQAVIADLKYGRGVVVEVHENPQQMIYALGLLARHPEVQEVTSYIVQPRAPHADGSIRWTTYSAQELVDFYVWLLQRVEAADDPGAPRIVGEHCRFCPDLANCPAALEQAQGVAAMEFGEDDVGEFITECLTLAPMVEAWAKAVRREALGRLMDEQVVPGWKLVHGRGTRAWTAEETEVLRLAKKAGLLKAACFSVPKLLSPHGLEQAAARGGMTGREAGAHFSEAWDKTPGGPAIAPDDDPREPYRGDPADDFAAQ